MPRNGAGTYTLPTGNPVVSGDLIEANWANTTLADVANELTNSLDRNGNGGMLAPFRLADGLVGAPGIAWLNEPSTGFYRAGAGEQWAVVSGNQVLQFTAGGALLPAGKTLTINGTMTFASPDTVRESLSAVKYTTTTGSALLPAGTTAQRDGSPTTGAIRYNTDSGGFEGYNGGGWDSLVNSFIYTQEFSGDSSTTGFTLTYAASSNAALEVFISGVRQKPVDDYTVSGTALTFVVAPPTGTDNIFCRWMTTSASAALADGAVTTVKIADGAVTAAKLASSSVTNAKIGETITVANGGTGATTLTGLVKGNGTSAFSAASAGTDYVAPGTATTFTATQNFAASGMTLKGSGSGKTTFASANSGGTDYTITLPASTGTVLTSAAAVTVAQGGTGLTTLTANNVILGNGTSNVQFVAPGTSGNVLTSNGTTWTSSVAPPGTGTGTGSYTTPARAFATTYTNSGSTTRWVMFSGTYGGSISANSVVWFLATVGGTATIRSEIFNAANTPVSSMYASFTFPVPAGETYTITTGGFTSGSIGYWREYQ